MTLTFNVIFEAHQKLKKKITYSNILINMFINKYSREILDLELGVVTKCRSNPLEKPDLVKSNIPGYRSTTSLETLASCQIS